MISLVYTLREALACIVREGIDESIQRHQSNAKKLYEMLETSGFELFVKKPVSIVFYGYKRAFLILTGTSFAVSYNCLVRTTRSQG